MNTNNRSEGGQKGTENSDSNNSDVNRRHQTLSYALAANSSEFKAEMLLNESPEAVEALCDEFLPGFTAGQFDLTEFDDHVIANVDLNNLDDIGTGRIDDV